MEIAEQHAGKITIVEVKGRIDGNTAKVFADKLTNLIKSGHARLVVDLKQIIYISSAGFRALLMAGQLAKGINCTVVLCSLSNEVRRLFEVGAFTDLFAIYPSREKAVARLSARNVVDLWNDPTDRQSAAGTANKIARCPKCMRRSHSHR
jgi:anti-sigma B factor antagonist